MSEGTLQGARSIGSMAVTVASLMPQLRSELARLVAIPSISASGYPEETHGPLLAAYEQVVALFRDAGVETSSSRSSCRTPRRC